MINLINHTMLNKFFAILACVLVFAINAQAADNKVILAKDVSVSTPTYKPDLEPALGTYTYEVSWQGIPAAEVTLGVEQSGDDFEIWTKARTYGLVDVFYELRYRADATLTAKDFHPLRSSYYHRENSRIKEANLVFLPNGRIEAHYSNRGKKEDYSFDSDNFTLDPFSAAFIARGLDWSKGASFKFDAFNGKSRYLITLTAADQIKKSFFGKEHQVWVINPEVKNLTSSSTKPSKLRNADIYLTADSSREILEIRSEVFVGSVRTRLVKFTPTTRSVSGTRLAFKPKSGVEIGR